jgi:hypothetical protein
MKNCIFLVIIIFLLMSIISGCKQDFNNSNQVITNQKIIQFKDFHINSESTELETSVRGTVFLSGEEGVPEHAQIVAMIDIDPKDWGGIGIQLTDQWNISSITSSYPEGKKDKTPVDYTSVWTTGGETEHGWNKRIEIGRDTLLWTPTGGGKGTIVIELDINEDKKNSSEVFSMTVGVGSEEKDGIKSVHPDWKLIEIPIP